MEDTNTREMTYGEKAVGHNFNPSQDPEVAKLKGYFAEIIDHLDAIRKNSDNPEVKRMVSVAITEAQTAQMWAVKAVTWKF